MHFPPQEESAGKTPLLARAGKPSSCFLPSGTSGPAFSKAPRVWRPLVSSSILQILSPDSTMCTRIRFNLHVNLYQQPGLGDSNKLIGKEEGRGFYKYQVHKLTLFHTLKNVFRKVWLPQFFLFDCLNNWRNYSVFDCWTRYSYISVVQAAWEAGVGGGCCLRPQVWDQLEQYSETPISKKR